MRAAIITQRARRDVSSAVRWIAKDNRAAANGLRKAVITVAKRIGNHPHIGFLRPDISAEALRFVSLTRYPYMIVYDAEKSPPEILRVLHGARDIPWLLQRP